MSTAAFRAAAEDCARFIADRARDGDADGRPPDAEIARLRAAGLLTATAPAGLGGAGLSFAEVMPLVRIVARGSGSVGQLLGYHYVMAQSPRFYGRAPYGRAEAAAAMDRRSVAEAWHWAGAANPRDPGLVLSRDLRLSGRKSFATGARLADRLTLTALVDGGQVVFAIPRDRPGVGFLDDWDHLGQRQTESGTIVFDDVAVGEAEVIAVLPLLDAQPVWLNMRVPMLQLAFVNFYIGVAEGAMLTAADYVRTTTRPWPTSGVERASDDPFILEQYGVLHADLKAAAALADEAGEAVDAALARDQDLTPAERTDAAAVVYAAKVTATRAALEATARIFDLMGARATARVHGFDRFWRDVRTHSLHDPVAYKAREVGNHALNGIITPHWGYT